MINAEGACINAVRMILYTQTVYRRPIIMKPRAFLSILISALLAATAKTAADMEENGSVSVTDAVMILRIAMGIA